MSPSSSTGGNPRAQLESLIGEGRYGEALRLLNALEAEHPGDRELLYARGYCLAAAGQTEEARQAAQTLSAIHGDPRGAQLLERLRTAPAPQSVQRPHRGGGQRGPIGAVAALLAIVAVGAAAWYLMGSGKTAPSPTLTVQAPTALESSEGPINIGSHAAPRLVDWNDDGLVDLLVGGGDGHVWIFVNTGSRSAPLFGKGEIVQSSGRDVRAGDQNTGACFADMTSDGLNDLIVAHSGYHIAYFANTGSRSAPAFEGQRSFIGPGGVELLLRQELIPGDPPLEGARGRIDVGDWNGDGLKDLIVGGFDGYLFLYPNTGSASDPRFEEAPSIFSLRGERINSAYNIHPLIYDFNGDGVLDLSFGNNWSNIHLLPNTQGLGSIDFTNEVRLRFDHGEPLDNLLRETIADDSIPNFADMNNDGVLDVVTGGKNGKLFVMYGVSHRDLMERIDAMLAEHGENLEAALRADEALRKTYEAHHQSLKELVQDIQPAAEIRQEIRDWYMSRPAIASRGP